MTPLVCLLHIIDCDKMSSMEYVYEGMYTVRLSIKKTIQALYTYHKNNFRMNNYTKTFMQQLIDWIYVSKKSDFNEGVMDVIKQKVLKGKHKTMHKLKLFYDQLESFGRELAYFSR